MKKRRYVGWTIIFEYMRYFSYKIVTSKKRRAGVAFPVPATRINFTYLFGRWLIESDFTVLGYLPVRATVARKAAWVSIEAQMSTWFCLTGIKKI